MPVPRNVVLVGMPGSGKSTVGRVLAEQLGFAFLDTDRLIEAGEDKPLGDVLAGTTPQGFLDLESAYIRSLACDASVVATGGSVVYCPSAMAHLKTLGPVVFLDVPVSVLEPRLADLAARGVVIAAGQTLTELDAERRPLYSRFADVTVACGEEPAEQIAARVVTAAPGF